MCWFRMPHRAIAALLIGVVVWAGSPVPTRAATSPGPILNLVAAAGDGFVLLRWDGPVDDGGAPITEYVINNYVTGVLIYQGYVFPTGNELTLGESDYVLNTMQLTFVLWACNSVGCGASEMSNEVLPTAGALPPQLELAAIPPSGGSAATDDASVEPSPSNPIITSVTVPATADGGSLSIAETSVSEAPSGYTFLGQDIVIQSSAATDAANPLSITFRVDPAQVPVTIFRNGSPITSSCPTPGIADPTPCIAAGAGTAEITILTAAASTWNVGIADYVFGGFSSPVDNLPVSNVAKAGRAIPVRFDLGGDQGLGIFAAGYPRSYPVACDASAPADGVEETLASSNQLSYAVGTGLYQLGWSTDRAWAGTCRDLVIRFRDGSEARARFAFR